MSTLVATTLGVVLAGGRSLRMGMDKAKLLIAKQTLLERSIDLLNNCGIKQICVSGRSYGQQWVLDHLPSKGPLAGIYSVLAAAQYQKYTQLLIIPVDMPLLTTAILINLMENIADYAAVCYGNRPLPLLLKNDKLIKQLLANMYAATEHGCSIKKLLSVINTRRILYSNNNLNCFMNINTLTEWSNYSKNGRF